MLADPILYWDSTTPGGHLSASMWLSVLNKYSENHTISLFSRPQFGSGLKEMNLFFVLTVTML